MKQKKALLIGPVPPPIGGDTVLTANVLASRFWDERDIELSHIDTSPRAGVRLPDEHLSFSDAVRGFRIVWRVLAHLGGTDIVLLWANSRFVYTVGLLIIVLTRITGKPIIIKVFGAFLAKRVSELPALWRRLVVGLLGRVDYILPETGLLAGELQRELGLPAGRVVPLPNFLPDRSLIDDLEVRDYTGRCVFIGQVKREKGIFEIIDAVKESTLHRCDLYGPILERDVAQLEKRLAGVENVTYRGLIDPDEVQAILRKYDALLLPTFHVGEGYPAVILQAFAAGVPVIASDWMSIPELVVHGVRGLLVPTHSPQELREALDRFASDPELYREVARNAFEHVRSFSERAVVRDVLIAKVMELCGAGV
ncbi:MAG: glycosyltransferase family 4 protein [bacterium]|nr:MAG: glycosyltransferase family 4 protein [bacterium]